MAERIKCKHCGAEFEYAGVAVEGKVGHRATQYRYNKIKEGADPKCGFCSSGLIWLPAMETIPTITAE